MNIYHFTLKTSKTCLSGNQDLHGEMNLNVPQSPEIFLLAGKGKTCQLDCMSKTSHKLDCQKYSHWMEGQNIRRLIVFPVAWRSKIIWLAGRPKAFLLCGRSNKYWADGKFEGGGRRKRRIRELYNFRQWRDARCQMFVKLEMLAHLKCSSNFYNFLKSSNFFLWAKVCLSYQYLPAATTT